MAKTIEVDYLVEIQRQREAWARKPSLRAVYQAWFARIVEKLSSRVPTYELGAGCGAFVAYYPEAIATDVVRGGPWIQEIVDARDLPWAANSIGNVVMIDCLHHLPRPIRFLRSLERVLAKNGRAVIFEPAATLWAHWFWKKFHHEPVDLGYDFLKADQVFEDEGVIEPENPGFMYSNMGTAQWLFAKHWTEVQSLVPNLELQQLVFSDFLIYPLTGGFSYRNFVPSILVSALHRIERAILRPPIARLVGLRMMIVLEKRAKTD